MDRNATVTVVNRTSKVLHGTFDGRPYDIKPGESFHPLEAARFFRYQNPIMGRGLPADDWSMKAEYLIGIKELNDDCSPVEQTNAPQRWDTEMLNGRNIEVVRPRGGSHIPEARQPQPIASEGSFVKP